jgi:hypothetical protein
MQNMCIAYAKDDGFWVGSAYVMHMLNLCVYCIMFIIRIHMNHDMIHSTLLL